MKTILVRLGCFFAGLFVMALLASTGVLSSVVEHPLGLAAYWGTFIGLFLWLLLGVGVPMYKYLLTKDSFFARLMTNRLWTKGH